MAPGISALDQLNQTQQKNIGIMIAQYSCINVYSTAIECYSWGLIDGSFIVKNLI